MKDYFKLQHTFNWRYWKGYFSIPKEIYEWMECFAQRGKQGYCYKDVWSVDSYLTEIIPPMIKQLKKDTHGYPASLENSEDSDKNFEKWKEILDKIILGFEAAKRLNNQDNWIMNEGNEMVTAPVEGKPYLREINFTNPWTEEQIKHFRELDIKDKAIFNEGMKLFHEYFFSLWD
jgi:hypothetical protein